MSKKIKWTNEYKVGIEQIDYQHLELFILINQLYLAMENTEEPLNQHSTGKDTPNAQNKAGNIYLAKIIVGQLVSYVENHFRDEEQLMKDNHWPELESHLTQHSKFENKMQEISKSLNSLNDCSDIIKINNMFSNIIMFLENWLILHIKGTDKKLGAYLNKSGVS